MVSRFCTENRLSFVFLVRVHHTHVRCNLERKLARTVFMLASVEQSRFFMQQRLLFLSFVFCNWWGQRNIWRNIFLKYFVWDWWAGNKELWIMLILVDHSCHDYEGVVSRLGGPGSLVEDSSNLIQLKAGGYLIQKANGRVRHEDEQVIQTHTDHDQSEKATRHYNRTVSTFTLKKHVWSILLDGVEEAEGPTEDHQV